MVFIESRAFTRKLLQLAGGGADVAPRSGFRSSSPWIALNTSVPGLGGVRKARLANPRRGKGKRGGYRHLYPYLERKQHVHPLILLDKNEQEDASEEQCKQMREWAAQIKKGSGD